VPGVNVPDTEQVRDPVGDHARLAAAGTGEDQQRAVAGQDGVALGRIQVVEQMLKGRRHRQIVPPF
jgi:hypothetical protein